MKCRTGLRYLRVVGDRAGAATKGNEGGAENEQAMLTFGFVVGPPHVLQHCTRKKKGSVIIIIFK